MVEKGGDTISLGTESWNVADGYVKLKILRQLVLCDKLETIAMFGSDDIDQELELMPEMIPSRRINSLKRLIDNLYQLFSNVKFAIRSADSIKFETLRGRIKLVEEVYDGVYTIKTNDVSKTENLEINEKFFNTLLNELREIKESVNIPINDAGLIFRSSDEIDFDTMIKQLAEEG